jgi:hypothetical protein
LSVFSLFKDRKTKIDTMAKNPHTSRSSATRDAGAGGNEENYSRDTGGRHRRDAGAGRASASAGAGGNDENRNRVAGGRNRGGRGHGRRGGDKKILEMMRELQLNLTAGMVDMKTGMVDMKTGMANVEGKMVHVEEKIVDVEEKIVDMKKDIQVDIATRARHTRQGHAERS